MIWKGRRGSTNIQDRRGMGGGGKTLIGGGLSGVIIRIIVTLLGGNPGGLLNGIANSGSIPSVPYEETAQEQEYSDFISVVLADTEEVWTDVFTQEGLTYEEPTLVLYTGSVESACGEAGASAGPFYCPGGHNLYTDLSFFEELHQKFQAPGDFAMAYVVAHEVGHHVQTLLGTSEQLMKIRQQVSETEFNTYLVKFELQADYLAGVWANHAQSMGLLEEGDLDEALTAASAVGDDTLRKGRKATLSPRVSPTERQPRGKSGSIKVFSQGILKREIRLTSSF